VSRPCDRHRHTAAPCRRGALSGEACGARPGAARCRGKERRCAGARPTGAAMKKKKYETAMEALQVELNNVARWLRATGKRLVIVFEGRDTAGKGGCINAIAERLNPRQVRVVA